MAENGEKSLDLWPENYTLLTEVGSVYVQRGRVDQAEVMASRSLELVAVADKPAYMTEQQWAEGKKMLLAGNHTTLGFVQLRHAQASQEAAVRKGGAENAIASFHRALEHQPADDFTLYGLGFGYAILNDYRNAESNLDVSKRLEAFPVQADPLICQRCGGPLKIISLIDSAPVIERILRHLKLWDRPERPPPPAPERSVAYEPDVVVFDDVDQRLEPTQ